MPGPPTSGEVFGASGDQQVGLRAGLGATLWTPSGVVDLQPAVATGGSRALAVGGSQQVGYITPSTFVQHAALWYGSAASFIDLHPMGWDHSFARATDGIRQGGWTQLSGISHAALWSGSATSHTDLHPAVGTSSLILGMAPGEQVGYVNFAGVGDHAALWGGSAGSYMDMNPPGAGISQLWATSGVAQAGYANLSGINSAGVWFGTPESFFSLHQFLPPGYWESVATSIAHHEGMLYVGGYAWNAALQQEAFLWVGPVPAPGTWLTLLALAPVTARSRRRLS